MIRAPQANRLSGQRKYHDSAGSDVSGYTLRPLFHSKDREIKAERGDRRVQVNEAGSGLILAV